MQTGDKELAALIAAVEGDIKLELELGEALGRFRRRRQFDIDAQQAADLLPRGVVAVMERQGCSRATAYRRAGRVLRKQSRATPAA